MRIRHVAAAGAAGVILAGAAALLAQDAPDGAVRVAFLPNMGHAIPIVGLEMGFFEMDVEPRMLDSGPQVIESLFSGSADIAYAGPGPAVNGFLKSGKITVLGGAASGGSSLIVQNNSGITGAAGLSGMIAAAPQVANTQDVSLRTYISGAGLGTAERGGSVTVLNTASPEIHALFRRGDIDAAWSPEPWATMLVSELGGERLFREESLWDDGRFSSTLLIASSGYIGENPEAAEKWLAGHNRTAAWIAENPDGAAAAFGSFMEREIGARYPDGVLAEAFSNIEITSDPLPDSVAEFARRADDLGYLGRGEYDLDGLFRPGLAVQ
ncbi:ABC-type nitrate/sulfonate/bicarbonate transport system, periplasmic component [Cenarchaeum symbiosum A]|uniref:ABC-type nitrate/sulfonate/bicarbonate transport system, periplasmic component n=1 Tax=Cenarchaeum symbiosum (strain A) TaxID=414004 RepID=A0RW44_CENSY|nr:ABC-type nitrate/sulfonate/bicarbonate transport system, periplasmic component [Cenarchaeum symbiosum A]